jgi:hypothetical protein
MPLSIRSTATLFCAWILSLSLSITSNAVASQNTSCNTAALPRVSFVAVPLNPTNLQQQDVGQLSYRGGILLQHQDSRFGAFSGVVVSDEGKRLLAVNNGYWLDGALNYDTFGNLSGFKISCFGQLRDPDGKPLEWWEDQDAEALTFDGENYLVGFEENLRIWSYSNLSGRPQNVPLPDGFSTRVPPGAGYSSLASDGPGRFYLITEMGRNANKDSTKGYLQGEGAKGEFWLAGRDEAKGRYLPVDWAVLPGGDFVLIEITTVPDGSGHFFKLRLSIIERSKLLPGERITPTTIAEMEPPLVQEKYEGVSTRLGPSGETLIYLMSDDGRMRGGRTVIRMFELRK